MGWYCEVHVCITLRKKADSSLNKYNLKYELQNAPEKIKNNEKYFKENGGHKFYYEDEIKYGTKYHLTQICQDLAKSFGDDLAYIYGAINGEDWYADMNLAESAQDGNQYNNVVKIDNDM